MKTPCQVSAKINSQSGDRRQLRRLHLARVRPRFQPNRPPHHARPYHWASTRLTRPPRANLCPRFLTLSSATGAQSNTLPDNGQLSRRTSPPAPFRPGTHPHTLQQIAPATVVRLLIGALACAHHPSTQLPRRMKPGRSTSDCESWAAWLGSRVRHARAISSGDDPARAGRREPSAAP